MMRADFGVVAMSFWCVVGAGVALLGCDTGTSLASDGDTDWAPPLDDAGTVGWRDSDVPWSPDAEWDCRYSHFVPLDVWSDGRSVYGLYGWEEFEVAGGGGHLLGTFSAVATNEGGGWTDLHSWQCDEAIGVAPCAEQLFGMTVAGMLARGRTGELLAVTTASASMPWSDLASGVVHVFAVNDRLAYALDNRRVVHFDGTGWSPLAADFPLRGPHRLWADETEIWAVGAEGDVARYRGGAWEVQDAGALATWSAVWGFGSDDVWVGGDAPELYHYDGTSWAAVAWPADPVPGPCANLNIANFWGIDGTLFATTQNRFARCSATGGCVVLADLSGVRDAGTGECTGGLIIGGLWGISVDEVFLALIDPTPAEVACGAGPGRPFFAWWDGAALHWF